MNLENLILLTNDKLKEFQFDEELKREHYENDLSRLKTTPLITIQEELIEFLRAIDDIHITYKDLKQGVKKISMNELEALTEKLSTAQSNSVIVFLAIIFCIYFLSSLLVCLRDGFPVLFVTSMLLSSSFSLF
jgi:hypothetical protein